MKKTKKTDKKASLKKEKPSEVKKLKAKTAEQKPDQKAQNSFIDEDEDEFGVPLDELEDFETFNEYDDDDDF